MDREQFLKDIAGDNVDARFGAWRAAAEQDANVVPALLRQLDSSNPGVAKAAAEALTTMVHGVGKLTGDPKRAPLIAALLTQPSALTLRLLSQIAGEREVPEIAKHLSNPTLREEAVYCLERIPGVAADTALVAGYDKAATEFKPRILAALGHRQAAGAVTLAQDAMKSSNADIANAGARAMGRIGRKPPGGPKWPKLDTPDSLDAQLRYADAQAAAGNTADAIAIYKTFLDRPEDHFQCAALVGLSKMATSEAAQLIFPKLKSERRQVRITASNAWSRIGKP
jgi:HEAT repeat protein